MLEDITWKLKTNIPCHSIDLYTHISLFEKATPVLRLEYLVRESQAPTNKTPQVGVVLLK